MYVYTTIYMCPLTMDLRRSISQHGVNIAVVNIVVNVVCALILLYMCPLTMDLRRSIAHVASYYICVLILLYMCPHTATYVSSYLRRRVHAAASRSSLQTLFLLIY
jgi:hypothetical protein